MMDQQNYRMMFLYGKVKNYYCYKSKSGEEKITLNLNGHRGGEMLTWLVKAVNHERFKYWGQVSGPQTWLKRDFRLNSILDH